MAIFGRGHSVGTASLLPSAHAVGHPFVAVGRSYGGLYPSDPHPLSYGVGALADEGRIAPRSPTIMR
jgi:hypothetical protein